MVFWPISGQRKFELSLACGPKRCKLMDASADYLAGMSADVLKLSTARD